MEQDNPIITPCPFKAGDKVRCDLDFEALKQMQMQEGHSGWNPCMSEYIGKLGTVHRITSKGEVRVQYERCANRWTFNADALTKVQLFTEGEMVKVLEDELKVREELQKSHGKWTDRMKQTLGRSGRVIQVYADGDLRVQIDGQVWSFTFACCQPVSTSVPHNLDMPRDILHELRSSQGSETGPDCLVREAAQGHLETVRNILTKFPETVDQKSSGKTALQVACHQGHKDIVSLLLASDASLEMMDENGETALHYSADGNQPEVLQLLLRKGAKIDALNNRGCSTLHVAVIKQHVDCVRALISHGCDVNIQDAGGNTALHAAMDKPSCEIIDKLIKAGTSFIIHDREGANVLHRAAQKGNVYATEQILRKCQQIVNENKDDGLSALHLAAFNGHKDVAAVLLRNRAEVDIRNNREQTPLLLAVFQGHWSLIELLVKHSADINVHDEDGNTCLHLALMRQTVATEKDSSPMLDSIRAQLDKGEEEVQTGAALAYYLAQQGASLTACNKQGKTPPELITDLRTSDILKQFAAAFSATKLETEMCEVCCNDPSTVTFDPCSHCIVCEECCVKMKKCLKCKETIIAKKRKDGSLVDNTALKKRLQEVEDSLLCAVCRVRTKDVVFNCGHTVCKTCSESLHNCPMCREAIKKCNPLYI